MSPINATNSSCGWHNAYGDFKIIAGVRASASLVSIAFGLTAILINVLQQKYRFRFHRMVLYLSLAAIIDGLAAVLGRIDYFVENRNTRAFCVGAGYMTEYGLWVIVLATFAFAFDLLLDVIGCSTSTARCAQYAWPLLIFLSPLSFLWIPFVESAYGYSANWPWCTIRDVDDECNILEFGRAAYFALNAPLFVLACTVFVVYVVGVVIIIRRRRRWTFDHDAEYARQRKRMEKDIMIFALPISAWVIGILFLVIVIAFNQVGNDRVLEVWLPSAIYAAGGPVSFSLTVDRETWNKKLICLLCKRRDYVSDYVVERVSEGDNSSLLNSISDKRSYIL